VHTIFNNLILSEQLLGGMTDYPKLITGDCKCKLRYSNLSEYFEMPLQMNCGAIILGVSGSAKVEVSLKQLVLEPDIVLFLFPTDVLYISEASDDFTVQILTYSNEILVEAATRIEHQVFSYISSARTDNLHIENANIIRNLFSLLESAYRMNSETTACLITTLQLRCIFLSVNEIVNRYNIKHEIPQTHFTRADERIHEFTNLLTKHVHESREVLFYANEMNITSKYLNTIVRETTGMSPKNVIDKYTAMLLKMELRSSSKTIEEISDEFHFPSQSYMGRFFKKVTGMSPTAFRQSKTFM
jgi:AraC-like DNA-binding protein